MIVALFDGTEIFISKSQADQLEKSIARDRDGMVKLNDYYVKKTAIAYIKPGGMTEGDVVTVSNHKQLRADNRTDSEQYRAARKKIAEIRKKFAL